VSSTGLRIGAVPADREPVVDQRQAENHPHRSRNLLLNHWLGRRWCEVQLEWLDEAERVLGEA
jgi:hypothetical protein